MLRNNSDHNRDGGQQPLHSNDPLFGRPGGLRLFDNHLLKGDMEGKLIMWILAFVGVPSYLWGLLLNIGTWKADVLFIVSLIFSVIYSVFLVRKLIDMDTMRKMRIKRDKRDFENTAGTPPGPESDKLKGRIDRMNEDIFRNLR